MVQIHVPPPKADLAQPAEHIHGKDGVFGSNPKIGSSFENDSLRVHTGLWGYNFVLSQADTANF